MAARKKTIDTKPENTDDCIIYIGNIRFRPQEWMFDPFLWLFDIFGDNVKEYAYRQGIDVQTNTGLSRQQEAGLKELQLLITSRIKHTRGIPLTPKEEAYRKKIGLSLMSGRGVGKDFFEALAEEYFKSTFGDSRIMCTALTETQLKTVLWSEIDKVRSLSKKIDPDDYNSPTILEHLFIKNSERMFVNPAFESKKGAYWGCEATTTNVKKTGDEIANALSGRHADHMLIVIDEAHAMPYGMFAPLERTLTQRMNLILMAFNPVRRTGYAIESQSDSRWASLHWNAEESEIVTNKENHTMIAEKYGKDSNPYRVDVLGLPPIYTNKKFYDPDKVQDAVIREIIVNDNDAIEKSVDCGAGGDSSIIATKQGGKIYPLKRKDTNDPNELTDWILGDFHESQADILFSDNISIGWGIAGNLRKELGYKYRSVDARAKARDPKFSNIRTEMHWNLRNALDNISLPNDKNLINAFLAVELDEPDKQGRVKLKEKKQTKRECGVVMDELDAVAQFFAYPTSFRHKDEESYEDDYGEEDEYDSVAQGSRFSYVGR